MSSMLDIWEVAVALARAVGPVVHRPRAAVGACGVIAVGGRPVARDALTGRGSEDRLTVRSYIRELWHQGMIRAGVAAADGATVTEREVLR